MSQANRALARTLVTMAKNLEEQVQRPAVQTGTVTAVKPSGKLTVTLDDGTVLDNMDAISKHVQEVGRKLVIGMNGAEPVILIADLIAARTILADMILAGSITANEITALLQLRVGQSIESLPFVDGPDGVGFHIGPDRVVLNEDVTIRGLLTQLPGNEILPNPDAALDTAGWTAFTGALTREPSDTDSGPGAFKHVTPASASETYIETGFIPIDRLSPYLSKWRVKADLSTVQNRVGIRTYDAAQNFIEEQIGPTLTGVAAYSDVEGYSEPPQTVGGNSGASTYVPNNDGVVAFLAGTPNNTAGQLYQNVDESVIDTSDYVYGTDSINYGTLVSNANIVAGAMTGKTILNVKFRYWLATGAGATIATWRRRLWVNGAYRLGSINGVGEIYPSYQLSEETMATNPATGNPWTPADVEAFRNTNYFGVDVYSSDTPGDVTGALKMEMVVSWTTATTGVIPGLAKVRLYSKPATAVARTILWSKGVVGSTRPQPAQRGGLGILNRLAVDGKNIDAPRSSTVATSETLTNTAYNDLATVGPDVTVRVRASGEVLVTLGCIPSTDNTLGEAKMSVEVADAITGSVAIAAADANRASCFSASQPSVSRTFKLTGLTAGTTYRFRAKYAVSAGNGTWRNRDLTVQPL